MSPNEKVDWSQCLLVEARPGVQGGAPVLLGARMIAGAIVGNFDYGVSPEEISEQFELAPECVSAVLSYAKSHRIAHRIR